MKHCQKTFTTVSGLNMGLFSPDELEQIISLIKKYQVPMAKVTSAQRLALFGMDNKLLEQFQKDIEQFIDVPAKNGVSFVQACPGVKWCKYGVKETLYLKNKLQQFSFEEPLRSKVKVSVAGCRMCCTSPKVRDMGFIASKKGWSLFFGGNGGNNARIADEIASGLSDGEALDLAKKCLIFYQDNAKYNTRTARFMERFGVEVIRNALL